LAILFRPFGFIAHKDFSTTEQKQKNAKFCDISSKYPEYS
jgi:hypothetical protein